MKKKRVPKFANVIRYLDEACNRRLLTKDNLYTLTTVLRVEDNYFCYNGVSIEYSGDRTYIRHNRNVYIVKRKEDCKYRNIVYLMEIAMIFERSLSEH